MKVVAGGTTLDLGDTEVNPTIGITDYSRRVTDEFGTTTVVERGFSRRMSVRMALPSDTADAVQQRLADIRATEAQWIADDRYAWLKVDGFFKDFSLDLAVPPLSYCTLTVEGLAETETAPDPGGDPAPAGQASTLRLLQPVEVTNSVLTSSSVPENDHPEWSAVNVYAAGDRVIKAATHRIYQSLGNGNAGYDPAASVGRWVEVGPTNRWAMFDQALGTITSATNGLAVTLNAAGANSLALLDVTGTSVRVTATGYDRTLPVQPGAMVFTGLPVGAVVTLVLSGTGTVSVGTLLIGKLVMLGVTEASPVAGINDYSRKEFDEFGEAVIVPRAWSKTMQAKGLIRTDALDAVANRIAAVRARPSLWIGDEGFDSLTIYGFFKDFSIEVGENVSTLSLSIEGLSQAAPIGQLPDLSAPPNWTDVIDNEPTTRPRPQDGATVGAPVGTSVGGKPVDQLLAELVQLDADTAAAVAKAEQVEAEAQAELTDVRSRVDAARARADAAHTRIDEITSESGDGDTDVYARSRIAEIETAYTEADLALAERIDIAEAAVGPAINAKAQEITTAYTDLYGALAERTDTLEAEFEGVEATVTQTATALATTNTALAQLGSTVAVQGASVTQNAQAISTLSGDVAELSSEVRSGGNPNLVAGGGFEHGMADWVGPQFEVIRDGNGTYAVARQNGTYELRLKQRFPVFPNTPYTVSAGYGFIATGGVVYVDMRFYDAAGNQVKDGGQKGQPPGRPAFATDGSDRQATAYTETSPANAVSADVRFVVEGATGVNYAAVREIKVEAGGKATAFNASASVRQAFLSVDGLFARAALELDVNGYVSGYELNNNGTRSDMRIRADRFSIEAPGGGPALQWLGGLLWNRSGSISTIIGQGFGTTGDLVFWIGPNPASPSQASKANALCWADINGQGIWAGATLNNKYDRQSGELADPPSSFSQVVSLAIFPSTTTVRIRTTAVALTSTYGSSGTGSWTAEYRLQHSADGINWADLGGTQSATVTVLPADGGERTATGLNLDITHTGRTIYGRNQYRVLVRTTAGGNGSDSFTVGAEAMSV